MSEAVSIPTMLRPPANNVIQLPTCLLMSFRLSPLRWPVWRARHTAAGETADFYDRTKAAYAALERVLREGGRIG